MMSEKKKQTLHLKTYNVVVEAVERGIKYGLQRAYKYSEQPEDHTIIDAIHKGVVDELCEVIDFDK